MVEFKTKDTIAKLYPEGIRELAASSVFPTAECGQLTDDSEMAIALLTSLYSDKGEFIGYDADRAMSLYREWYDSHPIDCGITISSAIRGYTNTSSEANGALMRVSGLAVTSDRVDANTAANWAREDAELTHPNVVCQHANQLFVLLIRHLITHVEQLSGDALHAEAQRFVVDHQLDSVNDLVVQARHSNISDFYTNMGWVRIALHSALFHLFNESSWRDAVHKTVLQGGDTDTNAAIVGALLGVRDGTTAIPNNWLRDVRGASPTRRPNWLHASVGAQFLR